MSESDITIDKTLSEGMEYMKRSQCAAMAAALLMIFTHAQGADAKEATRLTTDPNLTRKAIEAQMKQVNTERQVSFANMLLSKNLGSALENLPTVPEQRTLDIDLKGAVMAAIANNRSIRLSELSRKQAEAAVSEAAAAKNPSLSYSWSGGRSKTVAATQAGNVKSIATRYSNGLAVTWPIWTGGAVEAAIDAARYAEHIADVDVYETEADTKLHAVTAYYQYLEALNLKDVADESVTNYSGHLTNVEQQYHAGIVAKLDVLSSNVSLADAKQSSIAAKNSCDIAEANLNNIMRLPMNTRLSPLDKNFPEPDFDVTLDQAIAMAQKYRWELIKADYNVKIAKEQLRQAEAGYLPTIALNGGYNWNDDDFPGFKHQGWTVGAGVSWSLWDGGATQAKVKSAKAGVEAAQETLLQARESVELEVRQDYLNVLAAKEKIRATEASVKEAEEAFKIATVRYRSGVGINLDVLDAQLNLNTARTNYITALYEYNIGLATLEKAMGIPAVIHPEFSKPVKER